MVGKIGFCVFFILYMLVFWISLGLYYFFLYYFCNIFYYFSDKWILIVYIDCCLGRRFYSKEYCKWYLW